MNLACAPRHQGTKEPRNPGTRIVNITLIIRPTGNGEEISPVDGLWTIFAGLPPKRPPGVDRGSAGGILSLRTC
jgi:hypothetical protein